MRKLLLYIIMPIFLILLIGNAACGETYYALDFTNNSDEKLLVVADYIYPDTLLPKSPLFIREIKGGGKDNIFDNELNDDKLRRLETERITIFLIAKETYDSTPWDTIRKYNKILKRYQFNAQEYDDMGGIIKYP